ncbi:MAG: CpaD family pilus assembly lipoprotein, partial [Pseudomonadota bacterium]
NKLKEIKSKLARKNVTQVLTETFAVEGAQPALMISFDSVHAQAPSDCDVMPGIEKEGTTRFLGEYKFGCTVETMLARQVARPADLEGVSGLDNTSGGRREANAIESYAAGTPREPLDIIGRDNIGSQ